MTDSLEFAQKLAISYGAPSLDWTSLETAYRQLRDIMSGEYSMRMHAYRTAGKRAGRYGDYELPGPNFWLGASDNERHDDNIARKRAHYAETALASASAAMMEYDGWVQFKYILAILTGRYDGSEFLGGLQTETELKIVAQAFAIRRTEAPMEWKAAQQKDAACRLEWDAYQERLQKSLPPERWGRSMGTDERLQRWFSRPISERASMLACAGVRI